MNTAGTKVEHHTLKTIYKAAEEEFKATADAAEDLIRYLTTMPKDFSRRELVRRVRERADMIETDIRLDKFFQQFITAPQRFALRADNIKVTDWDSILEPFGNKVVVLNNTVDNIRWVETDQGTFDRIKSDHKELVCHPEDDFSNLIED